MRAAERLEHAGKLDGAAAVAEGVVRRVLPPGPRSDALHGVPLGQPAHPALAGLPLGFWTSAAVLDLVPAIELDPPPTHWPDPAAFLDEE